MDWKQRLGEEIRRARRRKGYTQAQLAETLGGSGSSPNGLGLYERGERAPSIELLRQIASILEADRFEIDENLRIEFKPNGLPHPLPVPQQLSLDFDANGGVTVRIEAAKEGAGLIIKKMA